MVDNSLSIFLLALIVLLLIFLLALLVSSLTFRMHFTKKRIEKEERLESLYEGGIEEPHAFRELTHEEKEHLKRMYKNSLLVKEKFWLIIPIFLVIDGFILKWLWNNEVLEEGMIHVAGWTFFLEGAVIIYGLKHWQRYLDLRSPVFKTQGKAIKQVVHGNNKTSYFITIRRLKFAKANLAKIEEFYNSIDDFDEIAVEYSPRTKQVWKIYKTEDLK